MLKGLDKHKRVWKYLIVNLNAWIQISIRGQFQNKLQTANINTAAVGMAAARPYGFEIDFVRNPISGSAAWFFVIILKFILTPIFEIKIHEKKFLGTKKNSFSKPDFKTPRYL